MSASAKLELVLEAIDRASGPLNKIEKHLDRMERASGRSSRAMTTWGEQGSKALRDIAAAATLAAGAVALIGTNVIASAADFESSLTGIQKKAGTTAEATAAIGEEIKALAVSGELASPISEIASAYERGAAAGLPIADLKEFALMSVKGADAFEMSAEEVGNFSAKLRTGLGMTAEDVRDVLDLTNSLADAGIADEKDIVSFMDRAGASLKTLGLAKEESLALGATLLNIGMPAEVAATGMGALAGKMLTVNTLGGKNKKTFERYMGPVSKFSKLIGKDANGALLTMLDRLKKLDKTQRAEFLQSFVGAEWADEMLRVVEASDEYRKNLALAGDPTKWMGSLDKSYALKLDDFWSQWQIAKSDLEKLTIDVGTMGMPAFKQGLVEARELIGEVRTGLETFKVEVDWKELGEARDAADRLMTKLGELLGIKTEGSAIPTFFRDLAKAVNDISSGIQATETFINRVTSDNPLNLPPPPTSQAEADAQQYQDLLGRVRADYEKRQWMKSAPAFGFLPDSMIGEKPSTWGMNGYDAANWDRALAEVKAKIESEGAAATQRATEIGQDVQSAASVTATPMIDTQSIDVATGKVKALDSAIRALPNTTVTGASATPTVPIDGARAAGGPVSAGGLYLVGEEGPELLETGSAGQIHTARKTSRLFQNLGSGRGGDGGGGSGGGPVDASIHIGSVNYGDAQGKEDFEKRLRAHQRLVAELVAGEGRRQSRANF